VLDLGDGASYRATAGPALWGAARGRRLLLGVAPDMGPEADPMARVLLEILAAGEALRRLLGLPGHSYDFTL